MIKINLVKQTISCNKAPLWCAAAYGFLVVAVVWLMHFVMYNVPATILNAVVVGVNTPVHTEQLIRGNKIAVMQYEIAKATWPKEDAVWTDEITFGCDETEVQLVFVKRHNGPSEIFETAIVVQDPLGQCNEGP